MTPSLCQLCDTEELKTHTVTVCFPDGDVRNVAVCCYHLAMIRVMRQRWVRDDLAQEQIAETVHPQSLREYMLANYGTPECPGVLQ